MAVQLIGGSLWDPQTGQPVDPNSIDPATNKSYQDEYNASQTRTAPTVGQTTGAPGNGPNGEVWVPGVGTGPGHWQMPATGTPANGGASSAAGGGDPVAAMLAAYPGMQPWVAQAFVQNGITPGPRGSGAGDWQYWQGEALNNANGDTGYIAGRIGQAGGQQGLYQGLGNYGNNPFGYTGNSLLTPWTQAMPTVPSPLSPFQFGQLSYTPTDQANSNYSAPSPFAFGQYAAPQTYTSQPFQNTTPLPPGFVAPTLDNTNDPGYAFRLATGLQTVQNQAAAQGARGGDVTKALEDYAQNYASNEYSNVFNRALQQYNAALTAQQQGFTQAYNTSALNNQTSIQAAALNESDRLSAYQTNFNAAFNAYNANSQNQLATEQLNSQTALANNALGWNIAQGTYNANFNNALTAYQLQLQQQQQLFQNQMGQYDTAFGIYNTNQGNQYNRLMGGVGVGQTAAGQTATAAGNLGNQGANLITGAGAAGAAGTVGETNAFAGAANNIGNIFGEGWIIGSPLGRSSLGATNPPG